jgi:MGT family glycosyltransferase
MTRYLFVTWDGGGNLPPELVLARKLVDRGHTVRFLGHRVQERAVSAAGFEFDAFQHAPDWDHRRPETSAVRDWELRPLRMFAEARDKMLFGPARAFAADVTAALDRHPTDALVVDFVLFGAQAAAEAAGLPTAVLWHTVFNRPDYGTPADGAGFALAKGRPGRLRDRVFKAAEARLWHKGLPALNGARAELGLSPLRSVFEQCDRLDRVLVMTSRSFDFAAISGVELPPNLSYVGPQIEVRAMAGRARLDGPDRPLVLVSLSTTYQAQEGLLHRVVRALGTLPVRGLVTTGPAVTVEGPVPANVEVAEWVPHADVLPDTALVVTHAGHGTVMGSLAHGVPLVCFPMGRDQPDNAARVVHAGAGLKLSPKASEGRIARAVRTALASSTLAANAARLADAIGDDLAADRGPTELEGLADEASSARDEEPSEPAARADLRSDAG